MKRLASPTLRVFVASTSEAQMQAYRETASRVARSVGCLVDMHEDWSPDQRKTVAACRERVERCHALVVIVGERYGYVPSTAEGGDGTSSITRLEVEHARSRNMPVYAFLVESADASGDTTVDEDDAHLAGLAAFKGDLQTRLAGVVRQPQDLDPKLVKALLELKQRLIRDNLVVAVVLAALAGILTIVGFGLWRGLTGPPAVAVASPTLERYVKGSVKTTSGSPVANATVAMACQPDARVGTDRDGHYTISLVEYPDACRTLPMTVVVSTDYGKEFRRLVANPDAGDLQVDDAPHRIASIVAVAPLLYTVEFTGSIPAPGVFALTLLTRTPAPATMPPIYMSSGDNPVRGLIVSDTAIAPGTPLALESLDNARVSAIVADLNKRLVAAGPRGLSALEQALDALLTAGVDRAFVSKAFRDAADSLHPDSCARWRLRTRWLERAIRAHNAPDLPPLLTDSKAHEALTCLR